MNRKQKKAKRLKAQAHTKNQARNWKKYDTPCDIQEAQAESIIMNRQQAEVCLNQKDDFGVAVRNVAVAEAKKKFRKAILFWGLLALIFLLVVTWSIK